MFLTGRGYDVRDVCANRTARNDRARQRGKSDTLDSERIAREVLAHPLLPKAFKRAGQDHGPDERHELLAIWRDAASRSSKAASTWSTRPSTCCAQAAVALRKPLPASKAVRPG